MFNHNGPLYDFFEKKYIPVNTAENLLSALSHAKTVSNEHRRRPDSILGYGEVLGTHEPTRFNHNGPLYDIFLKDIYTGHRHAKWAKNVIYKKAA